MLSRNYSKILLIFLFLLGGTTAPKKRQKKRMQVKYNSTDPSLQPFLKHANTSQIMDVEGTFFIRISRTKYAISATNLNWFKAYQMCRLKGGYLVNSKEKVAEVTRYLAKIHWPVTLKFWTAATCLSLDGSFRWFSSGRDFKNGDFKWAPQEPLVLKYGCVVVERIEGVFLMKSVNCETERALSLCDILESHKHVHNGVTQRKKKKTMRMFSIFT